MDKSAKYPSIPRMAEQLEPPNESHLLLKALTFRPQPFEPRCQVPTHRFHGSFSEEIENTTQRARASSGCVKKLRLYSYLSKTPHNNSEVLFW
jgi:hypothetical protein